MTPQIDFFLGSDMGLWALTVVDPQVVARVITLDPEIAELAASKGLTVDLGNANELAYTSSRSGYSVHYPRILKQRLLDQYEVVYNIHPGYLPWGRGYYPVFWSLWNEEPAGPTLHEINAGIDDGPIVDQIRVEHTSDDTGQTLFQRVRTAEKELFHRNWPAIARGERLPVIPQSGNGSYYSKRDFLTLKAAQGWESWPADRLIRLIRCLTVPQYTGWEVRLGGRRFELKLNPLDDQV